MYFVVLPPEVPTAISVFFSRFMVVVKKRTENTEGADGGQTEKTTDTLSVLVLVPDLTLCTRTYSFVLSCPCNIYYCHCTRYCRTHVRKFRSRSRRRRSSVRSFHFTCTRAAPPGSHPPLRLLSSSCIIVIIIIIIIIYHYNY